MRYRHDPMLVRMNLTDETFHCEVHGLLPHDEAVDVLMRAGLSAQNVEELQATTPRWRLALAGLVQHLRHPHPKCVPVQ